MHYRYLEGSIIMKKNKLIRTEGSTSRYLDKLKGTFSLEILKGTRPILEIKLGASAERVF